MYKIFLLFIACHFTQHTSAQIGINTPWTWMKGSDQISSYGSYGIIGVEHPSNEPIARTSGSTFVDAAGNLWLFGGFSYLPAPAWWYFNDLWKFNPQTNNWTWIKGSNLPNVAGFYGMRGIPGPANNPGAREAAGTWTDIDGNFWLFGGYGSDRLGNSGTLSDLWKYDVSGNEWVWVQGNDLANHPGVYGTQGMPSASNLPRSRYSSVNWMDSAGNLWLFGGLNHDYEILDDLWRYNVVSNEWTWMKGGNIPGVYEPVYGSMGVSSPLNKPGGRSGSTAWVGNDGGLYLFGGYRYEQEYLHYNDLWKYTASTNEWTWLHGEPNPNQTSIWGTQGVPSLANKPAGRMGASSFKDFSGNLWLFGGNRISNSPPQSNSSNDLWKYDPSSNQWTWVKGGEYNAPGVYGIQGVASITNKPGSRGTAMSWSDHAERFWLFGGWGYDATGLLAELNDLWKINSMSVVPVRLLSFTGQLQQREVALQWKVEGHHSAAAFNVERSFDGVRFNPVGSVAASVSRQLYHFSDPVLNNMNGGLFYRLKITDRDNSHAFSHVLALKINHPLLAVYPNPANSQVSTTVVNGEVGRATYTISDFTGRNMITGKIQQTGRSTLTLDVSALSPGTYQLKIISPESIRQGSFIKL